MSVDVSVVVVVSIGAVVVGVVCSITIFGVVSTGVGANIIPIMSFKGQFKEDTGADERRARPLIGIDQVIDCIGDNKEVVGYVNGVEYSGPYHVMSNGLKMTGATHSETDSIIYDTIEAVSYTHLTLPTTIAV